MKHDDLLKLTYFRGRVALCAILRALGIGKGDEVAMQAFTCLAVPEGIMAAGAKPRYLDISPGGYTLDLEDLRRKLTPAIKAIVVQHTFGVPADIRQIVEFADQHQLAVIEDCCHTLTSTVDGKPVGTFGTAAFYSFEWGKPIVAGVGGSLLTRDFELAQRLQNEHAQLAEPTLMKRLKLEAQYLAYWALYRPRWYWTLRTLFHGSAKLGVAEGNYNPVEAGGECSPEFQMRMSLRFQRRLNKSLQHVEAHALHAGAIVERYRREIVHPAISHPELNDNVKAVFARYPLRVQDKRRLLALARERGVELAEWYNSPIHPLSAEGATTVHYEPQACLQAEHRSQEIVSLPTHQRVDHRYVDQVVELLERAA